MAMIMTMLIAMMRMTLMPPSSHMSNIFPDEVVPTDMHSD